MIAWLRERECEKEAEGVIQQMGLTSLPICPKGIAETNGIFVLTKDSEATGVSGFLIRSGDTFGIYHASHIKNEGFIRFTIAHELGHYFLSGHPEHLFPNGNGTHQSRSGFISHDPLEQEADHFAASLLMPEMLFKKALDRAGTGFSAIESLAKLCKTSITATAIRFAKYTDDAVAVIVSSGNQVEFCSLSDRFTNIRGVKRLKRNDLIAPRSATAEFNRDRTNIEKARRAEEACFLDDWFEDAREEIEMNEDVVGLGSYGKTLTVLFAEDIEEEDESEEDED